MAVRLEVIPDQDSGALIAVSVAQLSTLSAQALAIEIRNSLKGSTSLWPVADFRLFAARGGGRRGRTGAPSSRDAALADRRRNLRTERRRQTDVYRAAGATQSRARSRARKEVGAGTGRDVPSIDRFVVRTRGRTEYESTTFSTGPGQFRTARRSIGRVPVINVRNEAVSAGKGGSGEFFYAVLLEQAPTIRGFVNVHHRAARRTLERDWPQIVTRAQGRAVRRVNQRLRTERRGRRLAAASTS